MRIVSSAFLLWASSAWAEGVDFHVHIYDGVEDNDVTLDGERASLALTSAGLSEAVVLSNAYQKFVNPACQRKKPTECRVDRAWVRKMNDWTAKQAKVEGGIRLHFFCGVPLGASWILDEMQRCVQIGAEGFKVHTQANGLKLADKATYEEVTRVVDFAEKARLPVLIHANFPETKDTDALIRLVNSRPAAKLVVGHALGSESRRMTELTSPNSCVELSVALFQMARNKEEARKLLRAFGVNRIVLGSDWPVFHPQEALWALRSIGLSNEELDQILRQNPARLLKR
jgi:predicted TIM-barrel fold metal-dependent hydrolase